MSHLITRDLRPSTVYHVGIYAYDRGNPDGAYATGRYVPLCGQEKVHDGHWLFPRGDEVDRKKLCSRCADEIWYATDLLPTTLADGLSIVLVDDNPDHVYLFRTNGARRSPLGKLTLAEATAMGATLIAYAYVAPRQNEVQS